MIFFINRLFLNQIKTSLCAVIIFFTLNITCFGQKVGLVLSGGGAAGLAHVGVIKALEENDIPIDYIAGNSIGALIGGMYAAGYSPEEMSKMLESDEFKNIARGRLEDKYIYYFKQKEDDPSWITLKFDKDTVLQTSLPTNVISPVALDFKFLELFSGPAASAGYDFDNLFIPFRCVASNIEDKELVVFRKGHLSQAVRASMSYPFYLKPIRVDGKLLFDGGLYNNFPSDIMYHDFFPDVILGSNVTGNIDPPDEDNLISQIKSMLMNKTNYSVLCENGVCINPQVDISLFDFSNPEPVIQKGYEQTMSQMEEIKSVVSRRVSKEEVQERRRKYKQKSPPLEFNHIEIDGLTKGQANYVGRIWKKPKKHPTVSVDKIKPAYFRVFGDDKIRNIYPIADYNEGEGSYRLLLKVKKEKDIILDFGGNVSNRPISQAYAGIRYNYLGATAVTLMGNMHFGKLYTSAQAKARFELPTGIPSYIEPQFTLNQWDYFKSKTEFFQPKTTSYLIQKEQFGGITLAVPVKNKDKVMTEISYGQITDKYYQISNFLESDTADRTDFDFTSASFKYERNTLNQKQYANAGTFLSLQAGLVSGEESTYPGSTFESKYKRISDLHEWYYFKLRYDNYYKRKGHLRLGIYLEGAYSKQDFFNNYTASVLHAPSFQPIPESQTLFLESFRAYKYMAAGHKFVINLIRNLDIRFEAYIFQPYQEIIQVDPYPYNNSYINIKLGEPWQKRYIIGSAGIVYYTPIGPMSLEFNYYHNNPEVAQADKKPLTVMFHFGYIIFNRKAID